MLSKKEKGSREIMEKELSPKIKKMNDTLVELTKKGLGRNKRDHKEWYESEFQNKLTFYASDDCKKRYILSGSNHVQIDFIISKKGNYFLMEYAKKISEGSRNELRRREYINSDTAIRLELNTFNPPKFENNKIKVSYINKKGKNCNILLGPCNSQEKEIKYKCPVRGADFDDYSDWRDKVASWFKTKIVNESNKTWNGDTAKETTGVIAEPDTDSRFKRFNKDIDEVHDTINKIDKKNDSTISQYLEKLKINTPLTGSHVNISKKKSKGGRKRTRKIYCKK